MQLRVNERGVIVGPVPDKQHLDLKIRGAPEFFKIKKGASPKIKRDHSSSIWMERSQHRANWDTYADKLGRNDSLAGNLDFCAWRCRAQGLPIGTYAPLRRRSC